MPPPPEKRAALYSWIQSLVPNISPHHLTKTVRMGKTRICQEFENLTEIQIEKYLMKPLQKIGSVERIPMENFRKKKTNRERERSEQKKKSRSSGRFARNVEFHE